MSGRSEYRFGTLDWGVADNQLRQGGLGAGGGGVGGQEVGAELNTMCCIMLCSLPALWRFRMRRRRKVLFEIYVYRREIMKILDRFG